MDTTGTMNVTTETVEIKRGRGRPKTEVGASVTRKNGTFVKGADGKFHKMAVKTTTEA